MNISPNSTYPRAATTTPDDKSNAITIVTWATLVLLVLAFLARQVAKFTLGRKVALDDLFILVATVFAVGLSVTALLLASNGLGVSGPVTRRRAYAIMKIYYASDFLYVSTLGFAKLSLLSFFHGVYVQRGQRRFVLYFGIFILTWTLASLAAVAFQCGLPKPWEMLTLHCYRRDVFWIVYCIIDMTSDVSIVMLSVNLVAYLSLKRSSKIAIVTCFAPRFLVTGVALARLIYLYPITPHDHPEFKLWLPVIFTQVQSCISIATACIPYMRPYFDSAEFGTWRGDPRRSRHVTIDRDSYGCCSISYLRGYKRARGHSGPSTAITTVDARTPGVSPRIPSPPPLSPLEAPEIPASRTESSASSRSPSERGLRLHIPSQAARSTHSTDVPSPQTASSIALSPTWVSQHPLVSTIPLTPMRRESQPPPPSPNLAVADRFDGNPGPSRLNPPRRFSLFPPQRTQYTPLPQLYTHPSQVLSTILSESSSDRINTLTMMTPTAETRTPTSSHPPRPRPSFPTQPPSRLTRLANDDPLRTRAMAVTAEMAVPAPIAAPAPVMHDAHSPRPPYRTQMSPHVPRTTLSSPRSIPSNYQHTPPTFGSPTSPSGNPYAYSTTSLSPSSPTSPQRQRNMRILSPHNSSRRDQISSPVSPATPPTPLMFWRDGAHAGPGWEDVPLEPVKPVIRDARSSPRIVVQRFS